MIWWQEILFNIYLKLFEIIVCLGFLVCVEYLFVLLSLSLILDIYLRGSLNKFPDFFRMGTFIDSTHMKL